MKSFKTGAIIFIIIFFSISVSHRGYTEEYIWDLVQRFDRSGVEKILSENPSMINAKNPEGMTPLHIAVQNKNEELAALLMKNGPDINIKDNNGITPLHVAVNENSENLAKLLIENGADINVKDTEGRTPLEIARLNNNFKLAGLIFMKTPYFVFTLVIIFVLLFLLILSRLYLKKRPDNRNFL